MSYHIVVGPLALQRLRSAIEWWHAHRPQGRDLLLNVVNRAIVRLETTPHIGIPHGRGDNTRRRLLLLRSRYHLVYSVDDATRTVRIRTIRASVRVRTRTTRR